MTPSTELRKAALLSGLDDWVGLWELVRLVREREGQEAQDSVVRELVLDLITQLLDDEEIVVGALIEGAGFRPWDSASAEAIDRIRASWDSLGRDPNIGEICWIQNTEDGDQFARRWLESDQQSSIND